MQEKIASPKNTMDIINKYSFVIQKKFGQNFLIDANILEKIVEGAKLEKDDVVLEIGPGIGSLTQFMAEKVKQVVAVEIDKKLIPILEETLRDYNNIEIINQDILKVNIKEIVDKYSNGEKIKVVANLPYYITTPIIMGLFENHIPVSSITVMIQKEVADRMQAIPKTKDYGALSLAVQYYSEPKIIAQVGPHCFIPKPKVGSTVISLITKEKIDTDSQTEKLMFQLIRAGFNQRRKTFVNTIQNAENLSISKEDIIEALNFIGADEKIRGEALSLENFEELAKYLLNKNV